MNRRGGIADEDDVARDGGRTQDAQVDLQIGFEHCGATVIGPDVLTGRQINRKEAAGVRPDIDGAVGDDWRATDRAADVELPANSEGVERCRGDARLRGGATASRIVSVER